LAICALLGTAERSPADHLSKYPDWSGQWNRVPDGGIPRYDPAKPLRDQDAPLRPEYRARHEASLRDIAAGGFGLDKNYRCFPSAMPRMMTGISNMEFVILPPITRVLFEQLMFAPRRIYTDGRAWPSQIEPTFPGYSIGSWTDSDANGRYETLEIETRHIRGPKFWDQTGMPMADDDDAVVKERLHLDRADSNILVNEMTTIDNSLTRPWSAVKRYRRAKKVVWVDYSCVDGNPYLDIEGQTYMLGGDGKLMPTRKDQPPPSLERFHRKQ
jgi:hypothetical protein